MYISTIEELLATGVVLRSWQNEADGGVWVALGLTSDSNFNAICKSNNLAKLETIIRKKKIENKVKLIPIVFSDTMDGALQELEVSMRDVINTINNNRDDWDSLLNGLYEAIAKQVQ